MTPEEAKLANKILNVSRNDNLDSKTKRACIAEAFTAFNAEREAKLIADTLRAAGDIADGVDSTDFAIQWTSAKVAAAIRRLAPAQIAAQAEERDRRVRLEEAEWWAEGHHEGSHKWPACPMCARIAAHRAAVQPGGEVGTSGNDS